MQSCLLRWVKAGSGYGQALLRLYTDRRKFMVYFANIKLFYINCFVSCYCYVADNVNKQISFYRNAPPSHKQRPLLKPALTMSAYEGPNIAFNLVRFEVPYA